LYLREQKSAGFEFFLQDSGIKFRLLIMRGKMQPVRPLAESHCWMRNRRGARSIGNAP
jgi:hypothetical protein